MQEAAHPPARVPSRVDDESCLGGFVCCGLNASSAVAAKAGADALGGGISLCFCRRGCAAPAQKPPRSTTLAEAAATLNLEICAAPSGRRAAFFGAEGS